MRSLTAIVWTVLLVAVLPGAATAQIMKELDPIQLEYDIYWGEPKTVVGGASMSFTPVDTKRGRRLEVKSSIQYVLPQAVPLEYEESCEMTCDENGVVQFQTEARAQGQERINLALLVGADYRVNTTFGGKKTAKTITSGVRRTNFGLFAAAFLAEALDKDSMMRDYPLLFPVGGDHQPRQKVREGVFSFRFPEGRRVPAIKSRLRRQNETVDHLWHAEHGHQILLRMEESSLLGLMTYELTAVNGVAPAESELVW